MSDQGSQFGETPLPFGTPPFGPPPFGPPAAATPAPESPSKQRGPTVLLGIAAILLVLAAGAAGAAIDHELWAATQVTAAAPAVTTPAQSGFGPGTANQGSAGQGGTNQGGASQGQGSGNTGGSSGFSGSFGTAPSGSTSNASGGPSDPAGIASHVSSALVDINSNFGFQNGAGAGTGVVVSANGMVLTNNHVIDGATQITATDVGNGKTYKAEVVGYDPTHDLAVLQLQGASGLTTAKLGDSSKLHVGDAVVGVGNAGGTGGSPASAGGAITGLNQSVTAADDSAGTTEQLSGLIQTNAGIQPGDSGGPLVDSSGKVIGIDTAGSTGFDFNGATGSGFAIPINEAISVGKAIVSGHGSSTAHIGPTAFLGISIGSSDEGGLGFFGGSTSTATGVAVGNVLAGEPAEKAGLEPGDVITSIDGHATDSPSALSKIMFGRHPGDSVKLGYLDTGGQSHSISVKLGSGPPA
jgi:S1-C subfamily serine protease